MMLLKRLDTMLRSIQLKKKIPDITNLATNTTLDAKRNEVKGEIPSITNLFTNSALNAKINEIKDKIPSINNLVTTTTLTSIEDKIPVLVF